jgi:DNA-binding LytR/AlgR family response regulator
MLRIAVCDNDSADLALLQNLLQQYFANRPLREHEIQAFSSPRCLQEQLARGEAYDLYLLDILMPEIDGISVGRLVRQRSESAPILYTTSSREFALDAYENHALRYLVKPVRAKEFASAMDFALSVLDEKRQPCYTIKSRSGLVPVAGSEIVLVEELARTAVYTLADGSAVTSVSIRGTFDGAIAPLPADPDFLHPHKSFFVNMRYIHALRASSILMDNGREIPVRRGSYPQLNRAYLQYLAGGSVLLK